MPVPGFRSNFPADLDDLGNIHINDVDERLRAERINTIQDCVYNLEVHTQRILVASDGNIISNGINSLRPKILTKTFTVSISAPDEEVKVVSLPSFTADELTLFSGTPLAATNCVQLAVRKSVSQQTNNQAYLAALTCPVSPDGTSQSITISPLLDTSKLLNYKVGAGNYIITLLIYSF